MQGILGARGEFQYDENRSSDQIEINNGPCRKSKCPRTASRDGERINNARRARNFYDKVKFEKVINSFRDKTAVVTCRGVISFRKRCWEVKKRDLVSLDNDIQDELRNF